MRIEDLLIAFVLLLISGLLASIGWIAKEGVSFVKQNAIDNADEFHKVKNKIDDVTGEVSKVQVQVQDARVQIQDLNKLSEKRIFKLEQTAETHKQLLDDHEKRIFIVEKKKRILKVNSKAKNV